MKRLLMPMLAAIIVVAMIVPGCGEPAPGTYRLTIAVNPSGAGTAFDVTAAGPYEEGAEVTIRAEANVGFAFDGWTAPAGTFAQPGMAETIFFMPAQAVTVTANFESTVREGGAWIDELIITQEDSAAASILKMQEGRVHVYGHGLTNLQLFETVSDDPDLDLQMTFGGSRDFMFNVYPGPDDLFFPISGEMNPFAVAEIREAMNWMIDRDYAAEEVLSGMGFPMYTQFSPGGAEETRYSTLVNQILADYAYSPSTGQAQIKAAMEDLGAVLVGGDLGDGGRWQYNGADVEITQVIRTDLSPYPVLGDYFADVLEGDCGFKVNRAYATGAVAWGTYLQQKEAWHVYGGGWGMPAVFRTEVHSFRQFNTHIIMDWLQPWLSLEPWMNDPEWEPMYDAIIALAETDFSTMDEREALVSFVLPEVMRFSNNIWSVAITEFIPFRADVDMVLDAAGGVSGLWAQSIHFKDSAGNPVRGGTLHMELPSILVQNFNPVAGSPMTYDIMVMRDLTGDEALYPHPTTGLVMPQHIVSAEVVIETGRPVGVSDTSPGYWCKLSFADTITVPDDAWADWDAQNQVWITAAERAVYDEAYTQTSVRKSTVVYRDDLWEIPMHDGSILSPGDFMLSMIMGYDRGKPDSPIFDPDLETGVASAIGTLGGIVIESLDPLTITTYSKVYALDAEHSISTWFPGYGTYGEFAPWHTIAVGKLAEKNLQLAFGQSKADTLGVEWMDYTKGPGLPILASQLANAEDAGYLPYAPTMSDYVDSAEIADRYAKLTGWYDDKGHFWVSVGPFYLEAVFPIFKQIQLKAFIGYPDESDKWLWLLDD